MIESPDADRWRIRESAYPIDTPHLRLRRDVVDLPDGGRIDAYYVRETRGFAVVLALRADGRAVLVRQYKHGIGETLLELPAGAIEPGETPADCAARELVEETGYTGRAPEQLGTFIADPTNSNGRFYLFLVRDAACTTAPRPDPTEKIAVETATLAELRARIRDGTISGSAQVCSVYSALDRLGML